MIADNSEDTGLTQYKVKSDVHNILKWTYGFVQWKGALLWLSKDPVFDCMLLDAWGDTVFCISPIQLGTFHNKKIHLVFAIGKPQLKDQSRSSFICSGNVDICVKGLVWHDNKDKHLLGIKIQAGTGTGNFTCDWIENCLRGLKGIALIC